MHGELDVDDVFVVRYPHRFLVDLVLSRIAIADLDRLHLRKIDELDAFDRKGQMPARPGQRRLGVLAKARHDAAPPFVDDVEAAREPDNGNDENQPGATELHSRLARLAAVGGRLLARALAAEQLVHPAIDIAPDLVEIGRAAAAAAFAPLRIVERHCDVDRKGSEGNWKGRAIEGPPLAGRHLRLILVRKFLGGRFARKALGQRGAQLGAPGAGPCARSNGRNVTTRVPLDARRELRQIALVENADLRHLLRADGRQHFLDRGDLVVAIGGARIDDVQHQVGLGRFGERRAKRRDEIMRQVADETDGVGEHDGFRAVEVHSAQRGVERGEQLVRRIHATAGEPIEERGFAGIRVADNCDGAHSGAAPRPALRRARCRNARQPPAQKLHALRDQAPVGFELRFAWAAQADAAFLPLEVGPAAGEARRHVVQLRELHLQLAFGALRTLREDVENEARAIDDATTERLLEIALLHAGERVVEDDQIRARVIETVRAAFDPYVHGSEVRFTAACWMVSGRALGAPKIS